MACFGQTRTAAASLARSASGGCSFRTYRMSASRTSRISGAASTQRALRSQRPKSTTTRISGSLPERGSFPLGRREAEVKGHEAAEDVRRRVLETAGAGGTVLGIRETDVAHAVEDPLEADPGLGAGERPARARMRAAAEGDVLLRVGPIDTERGRAFELARVAVGGTAEEHDGAAGGDVDIGDPRRAPGHAEVALDGAL